MSTRTEPATEPATMIGFGNTAESEAIAGALPRSQNSPRQVPFGLFAEQLNGTSFTVPRLHNQRVWLYRVRPSVAHGPFAMIEHPGLNLAYLGQRPTPELVGWRPRPLPSAERPIDFIDGLVTIAGAGDPADERGLAIHSYVGNRPMPNRALYDADGDLMLLPDTGTIVLRTELGVLHVQPGEFAVVPRGVKFAVDPLRTLEEPNTAIRGLILEVYARHFELPDRGPIGANGLADARHFRTPVAAYEDR